MALLGLESPGFESFIFSGCVTLSEALREFSFPVYTMEIIILSSKWAKEYQVPGSSRVPSEHCCPARSGGPGSLPHSHYHPHPSSPETRLRGGRLLWSCPTMAIVEMDFQTVVGEGSQAEQFLLWKRPPTLRL